MEFIGFQLPVRRTLKPAPLTLQEPIHRARPTMQDPAVAMSEYAAEQHFPLCLTARIGHGFLAFLSAAQAASSCSILAILHSPWPKCVPKKPQPFGATIRKAARITRCSARCNGVSVRLGAAITPPGVSRPS